MTQVLELELETVLRSWEAVENVSENVSHISQGPRPARAVRVSVRRPKHGPCELISLPGMFTNDLSAAADAPRRSPRERGGRTELSGAGGGTKIWLGRRRADADAADANAFFQRTWSLLLQSPIGVESVPADRSIDRLRLKAEVERKEEEAVTMMDSSFHRMRNSSTPPPTPTPQSRSVRSVDRELRGYHTARPGSGSRDRRQSLPQQERIEGYFSTITRGRVVPHSA